LAPAFRTGKVVEVPTAKGLPPQFLDKVYTDKQLGESKYAVCVPENYDGKTPLPVVLFLHGSGQVGTDNRK
jgi:predicted peptidase